MKIKRFEQIDLLKEMLKYRTQRVISLRDWDQLVKDTYGKEYSFQQQDGCRERQQYHIDIPSSYTCDDSMQDEPSKNESGVKFSVWLEEDPNWSRLDIIRNFYPDVETLANDLFSKGLIEEGSYVIDVDW
jgi:hypothetical protein